jgi:hypothetical protein
MCGKVHVAPKCGGVIPVLLNAVTTSKETPRTPYLCIVTQFSLKSVTQHRHNRDTGSSWCDTVNTYMCCSNDSHCSILLLTCSSCVAMHRHHADTITWLRLHLILRYSVTTKSSINQPVLLVKCPHTDNKTSPLNCVHLDNLWLSRSASVLWRHWR